MNELRKNIKNAAESNAATPLPNLDRVIPIATRTKRRTAIAGARVVSVVALGACAFMALSILGLRADETTIGRRPIDTEFPIPTAYWSGMAAMAAMRHGELKFTEEDCPYIDGPNRLADAMLVFPNGAKGVKNDDGTRSIVDVNDNRYGTEGETTGSVAESSPVPPQLSHACRRKAPRYSLFSNTPG